MKITTKINREFDIKTTGMKFVINTNDGKTRLGSLLLKKSRLVWCTGYAHPTTGKEIDWEDFIEWAETR